MTLHFTVAETVRGRDAKKKQLIITKDRRTCRRNMTLLTDALPQACYTTLPHEIIYFYCKQKLCYLQYWYN